MTSTVRRRPRRVLLASAVALGLTLGGSSAAWGWWTASQDVTASATAGNVPPPTGIACATEGGTLQRTARITWTAPSPAPASYSVRIVQGTTVTTETTAVPELIVDNDLLTDLLGGLFGSAAVDVSVVAVHSSGWTSVPSGVKQVKSPSLPQVGVVCVP